MLDKAQFTAWLLPLSLIAFFYGGCESTSSDAVSVIPPPFSVGLRSGDGIVVSLQSIPDDSSVPVQIDDQGFISLPYIGQIKVAGLTESEIAQKIRETYLGRNIYTSIDVSVAVTQRFIHVGGEVVRPGRVLWSPNLTLNKAIQEAGGFNIYGKKSGVLLTRDSKTYVVDAKSALRNPDKDFKVYPGDSLNVPRSPY